MSVKKIGIRAWRLTVPRSYRFSEDTQKALEMLKGKVAVAARLAAGVPIDVVVEAACIVASRYIDEVVREVQNIREKCDRAARPTRAQEAPLDRVS